MITGRWNGQLVSIKETWSSHTYTKSEQEKLFAGESIDFPIKDKTGKIYRVQGRLDYKTYNGKRSIQFVPNFSFKEEKLIGTYKDGSHFNIQKNMPYHCITDNEAIVLAMGGNIIYEEIDLDGKVWQVVGNLDKSVLLGHRITYNTTKALLYDLE